MSLSPSTNIKDAISRFPTREHPLYQTDETFENFVHYGEWLEEALVFAPFMSLEKRIIELSTEEFKLIEQTSIARDLECQVITDWTPISGDSIWSYFLNANEKVDDSYAYWRISAVLPKHPYLCTFLIIERSDRFNDGNPNFDENTIPFMVVTCREELQNLFHAFQGSDKKNDESIRRLLGQSISWTTLNS